MEYKIDEVGLQKHREQTVEEILELLRFHDRVACVRYTGFGKSYYVVPELIRRLNDKCLIVVPSTPLYQQYKDNFMNNGNVRIITYQIIKNLTELSIKQKYGQFKYIICDECHHLGENKWKNEFERFVKTLDVKVVGLTATPLRGDGINVVDAFFNNVQVLPLDLLEGINLHYLPKIKYVVAYADIDNLSDYRLTEIDRYKLENLLKVEDIIKKHLEKDYLKHNLKVLVYVSQVKYIQDAEQQCKKWFSKAFPEKVLNIYNIHSLKKEQYNKQQLKEFKQEHDDETIDIMVSVNMLTEGLHLPTINAEIMLRKTQSNVVYFQQLGRVINSTQPLVLDLINNSSYLHQLHKEYKLNSMKLDNISRGKLIFDDCVELYDETVEIENILTKYTINQHRSWEIDNILLEHKNYIETNPDKLSTYGMYVKLNISREAFKDGIQRLGINFTPFIHHNRWVQIIDANIPLIESLSGTMSMKELAKKLAVPYQRLQDYFKTHPNVKFKSSYMTATSQTDMDGLVQANKALIELWLASGIALPKQASRLGVAVKSYTQALARAGLRNIQPNPKVNDKIDMSLYDAYLELLYLSRAQILQKLKITKNMYNAYRRRALLEGHIQQQPRPTLTHSDKKYIDKYHTTLSITAIQQELHKSRDSIKKYYDAQNYQYKPNKKVKKVEKYDWYQTPIIKRETNASSKKSYDIMSPEQRLVAKTMREEKNSTVLDIAMKVEIPVAIVRDYLLSLHLV